jgi:hypothetical protein
MLQRSCQLNSLIYKIKNEDKGRKLLHNSEFGHNSNVPISACDDESLTAESDLLSSNNIICTYL